MATDYIIAIIGPNGVGKSTFLNQLVGWDVAKVGHSLLRSCTTNLQPVEVPADTVKDKLPRWDPKLAYKLIIVDTPGFDDTSVDDSETLKHVADWLAKSYGRRTKLAGIIYLQDIARPRVRMAKRNFKALNALCGKGACRSVVLGTTMWERTPDTERPKAESNEKELRKFWNDMIVEGSTMRRVNDEPTGASPWDLVEAVLSKGKRTRTSDEGTHGNWCHRFFRLS